MRWTEYAVSMLLFSLVFDAAALSDLSACRVFSR